MPTSPPGRYRLDHNGQLLEVEAARRGLATSARLFVDGNQVDERTTWFEPARLRGGGVEVAVRWRLLGPATASATVPAAESETDGDEAGIPFAPPPGSLAAKLETLAREHPGLYASRHVAVAILQGLIGLLGIGAVLRGLLPRLDLPAVPWPKIAISVPGWVRTILGLPDRLITIPVGWVRTLLDWVGGSFSVPGWLWPFVQSAKWWGPILIAVFVAIEEVNRRRRRSVTETTDETAGTRDRPVAVSTGGEVSPVETGGGTDGADRGHAGAGRAPARPDLGATEHGRRDRS